MAVKERLEYVLGFSVDASKAKAEMEQLQKQLLELSTTKNLFNFKTNIDEHLTEMAQAQTQLRNLQSILNSSFNKTTGQLNLNKMLVEIDKYGLKWGDVQKTLESCGASGEDALQQINNMVLKSDANFVDLGKHARDFVDQLYRSAKIQLSYKALSSMTSIFRDSYRYVVDLNKSLTNIQIVTQKSNQSMAEFAKNANKSAQSLSSKTLGYTDAALIYYQQGLNDKQVKERTDVTIKMANVTGQTASEVSDQMTAIWNNFAKGSDNLEHFADVITALGAATASSSKEISDGLQQFAAVANTVGLSYDYATSALATVVAKTRQSADSVGNSFKTIFARLQSLKQGDTLEDDTTLTKYSQALATVGVNIKLQNGELKNMDTILDELGSKWSTLNMEQKNALAYTVAGARQYTNFIALLDNWDYMKQNLDVAKDADGTLQKQQEVYTKSFEAATRRLTAAWEEFYTKILNDKALVWLVDRLTDLTKLINKITDGLGGLPGLLGVIAVATNKITGGKITKDLTSFIEVGKSIFNLKSGRTQDFISQIRTTENEKIKEDIDSGSSNPFDTGFQSYFADYLETRKELLSAQDKATSEDELKHWQQALGNLENEYQFITNNYKNIKKALGATFVRNPDDWMITDEDMIKLNSNSTSSSSEKQKIQQKMNKEISTRIDMFKASLGALEANHPKNKKLDQINTNYQKREQELYAAEEALKKLPNLSGKEKRRATNKAMVLVPEDIFNLLSDEYKTGKENPNKDGAYKILATPELLAKLHQDNYQKTSSQLIDEISDESGDEKSPGQVAVLSFKDRMLQGLTHNKDTKDSILEAQKLQDTVTGIVNITAAVTTLTSSVSGLYDEITSHKDISEMDWGTIAGGIMGIVSAVGMLGQAVNALHLGSIITGGWIAAIVAGVAAISLIYKVIKENSPEEKLKKAKEAAEQLQNAAESAKNEYSELVSTLDSLEDKYDAFKNLKEGTEEWSKAVQDLNDELREVILKYNLIYGKDKDWYYDDKGRIRINDEAQKRITEQARAKAQKLAIASAGVAAGVAAQEASIKVKKQREDLKDAYDNTLGKTITYNRQKPGSNNPNDTESITVSLADRINDYLKARDITDKKVSENSSWQDLNDIQAVLKDTSKYAPDKFYSDEISSYLESLIEITSNIEEITKEGQAQFGVLASTIVEQSPNLDEDDMPGVTQFLSQAFTDTGSEAGKLFAAFKDNLDFEDAKTKYLEDFKDDENAQKIFNEATEENQKQILFSNAIASGEFSMTKTVGEGSETYYKAGNLTDSEISEKIKAIDVTEDELDVYTELLKVKYNMTAANEDEERSLKALAVRQLTLNKGLENLSSSWDKYAEVLSKSGKDFDELSEDYVKGLAAIKENIEQTFGVEVSAKFIKDNLADIEKLAKGDISVLDELGKKAALDYAQNITFNIKDEDAKNGVTSEGLRQNLIDMINEVSADLPSLEIGATVDMSGFESSINKMLENGQMSIEQLENTLSALGLSPEIGTEVKKDAISFTLSGDVGDEKMNATFTGDLEYPVLRGIKKAGSSEIVSKANRTGGSKTSQKGSGGSKKDKKNSSDEIERYHVIKNKLEDINHQLDLISMAKDRAFGKDRLALLDKEIAKYKQLASAQEQYIAEINEHYKADQAVMAGYGALFDENGTITNYVEMMNAQIAKFNSSLSDEAEKEYNNFKKALENYESSQDLFQEAQKQWHEYRQKIFDAQLEKIEYKLEFRVDIDDEELKYLEYLLDRLDDAAYDTAESIANLGKQIDLANDKSQAYTQSVKELLDLISNGNGEDLYGKLLNGSLNYESLLNNTLLADQDFNSAQWLEDLQKAYDGLIEQQKEFAQLWDDYIAKMEEFWDSWKEKFDDAEDRLGFLKDVASNYKNLIDILGKDNLGISDATMARLDATMSSAATEKAAASYKEYLAAKQAYDSAMAKDLDPEIIKHYKEAMEDAYQDMQSDQSDAAQQLEDEYKNAIDRIFEKWEKGISGIQKSLAQLAEQFEMQNTIKNLWLDTYDQAYQTAKLTKDIADSIQDTDVISNKQELASLMEEINERQASGVKMSQYELDAYQKEYELLLAKAALEDAQNAKNQVRMTRDAEGNMSYTYTADSKAIGEAEDNYNDVAYQFAQLNVGQINDAQQQIIKLYQDMEEALKGIDESDAERRQAVMDDYMKQIAFWEEQMQIAFDWNADLTEQTGYIQWNLADNFADTVLSQVTGYQTLQEMQAAFEASSRALLDNLADADKQHQDKVADLLNKTGLDVDNMEDKVNDNLDKIQDGIEDTADSVSDMSDEFVDALDKTITEAEQFEDVWDNVISAVIAKNNELISSISSMLDYYKRLTSAAMEAASAMGVNGGSIGSVLGSRDNGNGPSGTKTPSTSTTGKSYYIVCYNASGSSAREGTYSSLSAAKSAALNFLNGNSSIMEVAVFDNNDNRVWNKTRTRGSYGNALEMMFDTGGYTGEWGSEGRAAILHEKELVLNKADTANMLSIVSLVRDIVSGFGGMPSGANANFNLGIGRYVGDSSNVDQQVIINAEFPNATNREEIQAAFDQMAIQATQYIKKIK